jgi:hypothetical protein
MLVRPVFVDVRGRRRMLMRVSATAMAVVSIAFIAGAGLLLAERPITDSPGLPGNPEPATTEVVSGDGTAADAPEETSVPAQPVAQGSSGTAAPAGNVRPRTGPPTGPPPVTPEPPVVPAPPAVPVPPGEPPPVDPLTTTVSVTSPDSISGT